MDDEVEQYSSQLHEIETELESCDELARRNELLAMKRDVTELIALLTERDESGPSKSAVAEHPAEHPLVGTACRALYNRQVDRALLHHDALILSVIDPAVALCDLEVTVLYSHPLEDKMRPCEHFLADRCTYAHHCRFSHGERVRYRDLLPYQLPDFEGLKEGSVVLVEGANKLWSSARVSAIDGEQVAVRLLSSGLELASDRQRVIPLAEQCPASVSSAKAADDRSQEWAEQKQAQCGRVNVAQLGDWEQHTRGIGMRLLLGMGYRPGQGLGRHSDGIVHAIQPRILPHNKSLDALMEYKQHKVVDGATTTNTTPRVSQSPVSDLFDVLNRTLNPAPVQQNLKNTPCHGSAAIESLHIDTQIKQLRTKRRHLREGITRNQRDRVTTAKLKKELDTCQLHMDKLKARQQRLSNPTSARRAAKDLF